jgi:hypothetical protein
LHHVVAVRAMLHDPQALALGEIEQRRLGLTRAQLAYRLKQAGAPEAAGRRPGDDQNVR